MVHACERNVRVYSMLLYLLLTLFVASDLSNAEATECEHHSIVLKETKGSISSPHYPLIYPDHACYSWTIDISPGYVLVIRVQDVDIEEDPDCDFSPCCRHSWLSLPQKESKSQRVCGHNRGRRILSATSERATIKFYTSKVVKGGRGFNLTYSVEHESAVCLGWDEVACGSEDRVCYSNVTQRCDGVKDCTNGIDEMGCGGCGIGEILCVNGDGCYNKQQLCDGKPDCVDFSDEVNCGYCPSGEALCSADGSKCFNPRLQLCNGKLDCPCGEDEVNCNPSCPGKIACANGNGCFTPADLRNDGQTCLGSDTTGVDNARVLGIFANGKFRCDNGHCISYALWCNGVDNCGDNSDEETCIKNSVITAAIMGSLTCGLLLVIAVGCMCRLYSLRLAVGNGYRMHGQRTLTPSRLRAPVPHPEEEFFNREPPPAYSVAVSDCQQLQRLSQAGNSRIFAVAPDQGQNQRQTHNNRRSRRHSTGRRRSLRSAVGRNSPMADPGVFGTAQSRSRISHYSINNQQTIPVSAASTLETSLASQRESVIVSSRDGDNKSNCSTTTPQISTITGERSVAGNCVVDVNPDGDISSSSTSSSLSPSHDSMTSSTSLMSYLSGNDDDTQLLVLPSS